MDVTAAPTTGSLQPRVDLVQFEPTGEVMCGTAPFFKLFAALKDVPPK